RRLNRTLGVKSRYVGYGDGDTLGVEALVMQHYAQPDCGWAGWHCEGRPLQVLFWLLCWDEIFASGLPDVFKTPYQDAPLDLDCCPLFFTNRRAALTARLALLREAAPASLAAMVAESWRRHSGTLCRGVSWDRHSVRQLQAVAAGLGGRGVAAVLATLSLSHKHFSGGMPDLLLLRLDKTGAATAAAGT
ncbi:unnamed protein product, partial [Phaeothamnion confervicola]